MDIRGCMVRRVKPEAKPNQRGRNFEREAGCCVHCGSSLVRPEHSPFTAIVNRVSEETGVSVAAILGNSRKAIIVHARLTAIYRCRAETHRPYTEIGLYFGGRERSSIRHAIKLMEKRHGKLPPVFNTRHRLTPETVHAIRAEYALGGPRGFVAAMAEKYNINRRHLTAIVRRELWRHV